MTEPLGKSQVIPYVSGLARHGWRMSIVAMEPAAASDEDVASTRHSLERAGVSYSSLRRSNAHDVVTKVMELTRLSTAVLSEARRIRPSILHARSHVPATAALTLAPLVGAKVLFDCRGLVGDEYVEAGHWAPTALKYRLLKTTERQLFRRADAIVVLTNNMRTWLREGARLAPPETPVVAVPCCVDRMRFRYTEDGRQEIRRRLDIQGQLLLVYSGSLSPWYCERETARFFAALRRRRPARLLVLTRSAVDRLRSALRDEGVPDSAVHIEGVTPADMPTWLSAADAAVSFRNASLASVACSPTKLAEYLAIGLPVVMNRGIGDGDALLERGLPFVDAEDLSSAALERAATRLAAVDTGAQREAAQAIAAEFDLDEVGVARYRGAYERLLGDRISAPNASHQPGSTGERRV